MTPTNIPIVKDLVLVGGGHSHVIVLKQFAMRPMPGVRVTLIGRDIHTPYSGMLPGLVAGHYGFDDAHIDLNALARFAGARFIHAEATGLDLVRKQVICDGRPGVPYDVLSIDTGSAPRTDDVPGAAEHTIPVKPIHRFLAHWERMMERTLAADGPIRIAVVGAGAGGVELLLSIEHRLRRERAARGLKGELTFDLFSGTATILPALNETARIALDRILRERSVVIHTGVRICEVGPGVLRGEDGAEHRVDEIFWVTAAGAPDWPRQSGLAVDRDGFIEVDEGLQSVSHPGVFAAGDVAAVRDHPRPKSGVFAVRQGKPLARNLRRALLSKSPRAFRPQHDFLMLISTGERYAVGARGGWAGEGRWLWRLKDWIDRRFMAKFNDLPVMDDPKVSLPHGLVEPSAMAELAAHAMRCGGCGAKVGATILRHALNGLHPVRGDDIVVGLGERDDAAIVRSPSGDLSVHTVDAFRPMIADPFVFGKIAANHCLGDIFAMGAVPTSALALVSVPNGLAAKTENELTQMMSGALVVLNEAGVSLIGGHTGEGTEASLGFAINGRIAAERITRKAGLRVGDRLILTKPLGTGTLFAADMRSRARGRWIAAAIRSMTQSSRTAAEILFAHGARACTDVTGFGLVGHLSEMVENGAIGAELNLSSLPLLDGAVETMEAGFPSSLQPHNEGFAHSIANADAFRRDARFRLLFDPQTAGGLLAGIGDAEAQSCLAALHEAGYRQAAIVGTVIAPQSTAAPIRLRD